MSSNRTDVRAEPRTSGGGVAVVGGSHVGRDLAARLANDGVRVRLVDRSIPARSPAGATTEAVAAFDAAALEAAGVGDSTAVVAASVEDAENLLIAQVALSRFDADRVVALVNDPRRTVAFEALGVETVDVAAVLGRAVSVRW
jgi:trk system potassium uptake protein TrkA